MIAITHDSPFWIVGAGRFGARAAERLCKKRPGLSLTVIDQDAEALERVSHLPEELVLEQPPHQFGARVLVVQQIIPTRE